MHDIIVIRHLPTLWNKQKRLQGLSDIDIIDHPSITLPDIWAHHTIYVSPLKRAQQTANILGCHTRHTSKFLIEMSFGDYEGRLLEELRREPSFIKLERLGLDFHPPNGESPRQVIERLRQFVHHLPDGRYIWITHKAVMRAMHAWATGWDMRDKEQPRLDYSCAQRYYTDDSATNIWHGDYNIKYM